MSPAKSLAWKEWHETRMFLWIAIFVFIALPLIGAIEAKFQYGRRFEIPTTPWVFMFGGVLAVFVGVGATCRDFAGKLEDFWRSRPVSVTRWLLMKYLIGLAVVLTACMLPLALEIPFSRDRDARPLLAWFPFLWTALYSIGFLAGCVVRRTAHAAMLALAAMLLVYFLPVIFPPIQWLNTAQVTDGDHPLPFAAGMLGLSLVALAIALLAVHRDWQIESGQKMMYGSVSSALLILFASAAFQLGTNLPILQQIDLPNGEVVQAIQCDGRSGVLLIWHEAEERDEHGHLVTRLHRASRTLNVVNSRIELGDRTDVEKRSWFYDDASPSGHPGIGYRVGLGAGLHNFTLNVVQWGKDSEEVAMTLWDYDRQHPAASWNWPRLLYVWHNRLYVIGRRLVVADITDPLTPRKISDTPFEYNFTPWNWHSPQDKFLIALPPVPDLQPRQRLEAALRFAWGATFENDILCMMPNSPATSLLAYRLTKLTDDSAKFEKIGQYDPTTLEHIFGSYRYGEIKLQNGLLYASQQGGRNWFNAHVSVFEVHGAHPLKPIGHFAAPGTGVVCPLPDGRALVGGSKLWLVGPPARRGSELK